MSMLMEHEAFARGRAAVEAASERLAADQDRIDDRVTGFLTAGWTGRAADAFAAAWSDWRAAASDVEEGLHVMAVLLDAVQHDFLAQDDASQADLDRVSARIVGRLG